LRMNKKGRKPFFLFGIIVTSFQQKLGLIDRAKYLMYNTIIGDILLYFEEEKFMLQRDHIGGSCWSEYFDGLKFKIGDLLGSIQTGNPYTIAMKGIGIGAYSVESLKEIFIAPQNRRK